MCFLILSVQLEVVSRSEGVDDLELEMVMVYFTGGISLVRVA